MKSYFGLKEFKGFKMNSGEQILMLLSQICKKNQDKFENAINSIYGRENAYINVNKDSIKRVPKRIPDSRFWFESNLSLPQRIILTFKIMDEIRYTKDEIVETIRLISTNSKP